MARSADGNTLFAVNTPANTLDIFTVNNNGFINYSSSVSVGLDPVAVAVKSATEIWVVNHLSDSISIIDLSGNHPRVKQTLLVGDEPRDIVFAGDAKQRAFITTAHRGQNSPYGPSQMPNNPAQATTAGSGRADVWVFDADNTGTSLGGNAETIITLFTDTPRALAVSTDGKTVYAAGFLTGNQTTTITEGGICDGGSNAASCVLNDNSVAPGGLSAPNANNTGVAQNETGLIVRFNKNNNKWEDEEQRDWTQQVNFNLPDFDVFSIDATATPPVQTAAISSVGTALFNMVVNPSNGKIYVSNTEAQNEVRFEGTRLSTNYSTVNGHSHESRISIIDGTTVTVRHLNKHIDYNQIPAVAGTKQKSLAIPNAMAISSDGATLYVAAFGSSKVGIFNTAKLEDDSFTPNSSNHIILSGGGISGLVLNENIQRLFAMNRFNNTISVIDTLNQSEAQVVSLLNPEPSSMVAGRQFLYDANLTSSNGEASCASCHVFGDFDSLAWDLGNPEGEVLNNPNPSALPLIPGNRAYHPLKGPMTTQSLRGLKNQGPLHWRGDRTAAHSGGDSQDSHGAFKEFNVAFPGLLGRNSELLDTEIDAFATFMLQVTYPPNPNRALDNSLTNMQQMGSNIFFNNVTTGGFFRCNQCHEVNKNAGFFGSNGKMSFDNEPQDFKIAHLRNMYQKVGMFGMSPATGAVFSGGTEHKGDQIKGFGFIHDGSVDTLARFHDADVFNLGSNNTTQQMGREALEQFMLAMDSNLKPIVGQQVTRDENNENVVSARIQLIFDRMDAGDNEVIATGINNGAAYGATRLSDGNFQLDDINQTPISESSLLQRANTMGQEITITAVPIGSARRLGVDSDDDLILNSNDNCPITANNDQLDSDMNGVGDACQ